jgi:hypothetical protein
VISAEVKKFLARKPFRPFTIWVADGQRFAVNNPEAAFVSPGGRVVYVFANNPDAADTVDTPMITTLMPKKSNGNGKHKSNGH